MIVLLVRYNLFLGLSGFCTERWVAFFGAKWLKWGFLFQAKAVKEFYACMLDVYLILCAIIIGDRCMDGLSIKKKDSFSMSNFCNVTIFMKNQKQFVDILDFEGFHLKMYETFRLLRATNVTCLMSSASLIICGFWCIGRIVCLLITRGSECTNSKFEFCSGDCIWLDHIRIATKTKRINVIVGSPCVAGLCDPGVWPVREIPEASEISSSAARVGPRGLSGIIRLTVLWKARTKLGLLSYAPECYSTCMGSPRSSARSSLAANVNKTQPEGLTDFAVPRERKHRAAMRNLLRTTWLFLDFYK